MNFGDVLRAFRQISNDPGRLNRRLSQERLGRLIGEVIGDMGFTGAAVSDWELGKSKIHADDRKVLLALLKVLHTCGGVESLADANRFLESGNYRTLNDAEALGIFVDNTMDGTGEPIIAETTESNALFQIENFFAVFRKEWKMLIAKAKEEGPDPWWPRLLAAVMRKVSERLSVSPAFFLWVWIGLAAWWLIAPSLRLPFANQSEMLLAMGKYVIGSLVIPLAIGSLVNTKNNEYWKQKPLVSPFLLRLYTYQGASIGFNIGYFFVYPFALAGYYLNIDISVWVEIVAVAAGIVLGNMSAQVVPHNLWRAFGRLNLSDGAVFFAVALMGPAWGFFFLEFSSILLAPATGISVILLAFTILVFYETRKSKK